MNKNMIKIVLIVIFIVAILPLQSQTQPNNIKIASEYIFKNGSEVLINLDIVLDEIYIESNDMIILTPMLQSNEPNGEILSLSPIAITGKVRGKIVSRKEKLGNQDQLPFKTKPQTILKRENNRSQTVNYSTAVPYQEWMNNASLIIEKTISGCANCSNVVGDQLIVQNILRRSNPTSYKLTYIRPNVEPVKERIDKYRAIFSYVIDSYELLKDYENNSSELAQIEKILEEIKVDKDIEIKAFTIVGYASPEGRHEYNRVLAENRANSLADYLTTKLSISRDKFTVEGKGEDWSGLYRAVSKSDQNNKADILNIIDTEQNPDARDRKLKKLSNGNTYKILLRDFYPQLRRTEYNISYVVRAFDIEKAKHIIKTNPEELSLNEMFLVAETYPSGSKEFQDVFHIIVQLYPDSEIAIVNSAAADIQNKNYDKAIDRLKKIENNPVVWNNLGVAYALKNDIQKASEYFKKSLNKVEAEANIRVIQGL